MEIKVNDVIMAIEEFAPASLQESWDNSGLIVGSKSALVRKALLSLDCTLEVVKEAKEIGANLIITHHPIIFKGIKQITDESVIGKVIFEAIKADIAIYSCHTNIDKVPDGVSCLLSERLNLKNREILGKDGDSGYGLGIVGETSIPYSSSQFISMLKESFNLKIVRSSMPISGSITRVAVCGGSGSSLIGEAMRSGAQILVTGDISYHNFFCEDGFMVADIGHYESEIDVLDLMISVLLKKIPNFAVCKSERNNNPIYYH